MAGIYDQWKKNQNQQTSQLNAYNQQIANRYANNAEPAAPTAPTGYQVTGTQQSQAQQQKASPSATTAKPAGSYTGLEGVSAGTAYKVGQAQQGYQQSDAVTQAQQALQQLQSSKPQGYTSKYGDKLDAIMQQIQNPEKFKYSFNEDELFKNYADIYTQKGKQASLDTMGQAAALTGGYGNSYAQQAGGQAYQQYLMDLYQMAPEFYDRAYRQYRDRIGDQYNQYNLMAQAEDTDYGRYRDTVGDWERERDYLAGRADTEAERDYNRYKDNLDYWTGLAQVEHAAYSSEQERQEAIRQYEQSFAEGQRQFDQEMAMKRDQFDREYDYTKMSDDRKYAYETAMSMLQAGQMPSDDMLMAAGLSAEDAQKILAAFQPTGGGGGGRTGKGDTYYEFNGHFFRLNEDGQYEEVDKKDIKDDDIIDKQRYRQDAERAGEELPQATQDFGSALGSFFGIETKKPASGYSDIMQRTLDDIKKKREKQKQKDEQKKKFDQLTKGISGKS